MNLLWIIPGFLGLLLILLLAAVIRTLLIPGKQSTYMPHPDQAMEEDYARKLS